MSGKKPASKKEAPKTASAEKSKAQAAQPAPEVKASGADESEEGLLKRFVAIGLDAKEAAGLVRNKKAAKQLSDDITLAGLTTADRAVGNLILAVANKLAPEATPVAKEHRKDLLRYIVDRKIANAVQVDAAIKYLKKTFSFNVKDFEAASGVGVVMSAADIKKAVTELIAENKEKLVAERYRITGPLLSSLADRLPFADGKARKDEFDAQILALLGPKTEEDNKKPDKAAKKPVEEVKPKEEPKKNVTEDDDFLHGREIPWAVNTEEQLKAHKKATGGIMVTRFPPEPNGFLHIGHAKACGFNFGLAKKFGGKCIMRFDDTNPEAEEKKYFDSILEDVKFLGHEWSEITYSSDYFQELYDLAVKLIKKGLAYVDHQTKAEMEEYREKHMDSPWRTRSVEENLRLFEDMRKGKYAEGEATLRMKGDMKHSNPQFWDIVAYRIKYTPHPHAGDKWCIYPSYDYTHCIIDSLENITHSLCTLEFEVRRESYFWLLHVLDLYKPKVWEYSRLNVEHNVMSKRRLLKLVNDKIVRGWDDPRMLTIKGLRRRGYSAEAINKFIESVGVTRSTNLIPITRLEQAARDDLEVNGRRAMAVLYPLKVTLTNVKPNEIKEFKVPNFPRDESKGFHTVPLTRTVYIDKSDFRMTNDDKDFRGLVPGGEVFLKYCGSIKCTDVKTDAKGEPVEILATVDFNGDARKIPGKIHWVSESKPGQKPQTVEMRLYGRLFKSRDPAPLKEWLEDIDPESLVTVENAFIDASLADTKPGEKYQFERVGYFCTDEDSLLGKLVFNRTVPLQEAKELKQKKGQTTEERVSRKPKLEKKKKAETA